MLELIYKNLSEVVRAFRLTGKVERKRRFYDNVGETLRILNRQRGKESKSCQSHVRQGDYVKGIGNI